jgi:hypothetical protein
VEAFPTDTGYSKGGVKYTQPHWPFGQTPTPPPPPVPVAPPPDPAIQWMLAHKWICWAVFWLLWLHVSPETIIPGSVVFMVGYVYYRERTVNMPSICATYLGFWLFVSLAHMSHYFSDKALIWMGWAMWFSLAVLAARYPMLLWIVCMIIVAAVNRGYGYGGGYYGRRRW